MTITLTELEWAADHGLTMSLPDGGEVEAAREEVGVTPVACAAAVGISELTWRRYERGVTRRFMSDAIDKRAGRVVRCLTERAAPTEAVA